MDKKDPKKLGDVKLSGDRANKFMSNFDPLVDVCTNGYDPAFTSEWKDCCSQFVHVIGLLEGKMEFRPEDVDEFQLRADEFCDIY